MQILSRKIELRVALMVAMTLFCAQWAAQAHAYRHLSSKPVSAHQLEFNKLLCSQCLGFAPLLATAAGSSLPSLPPAQGVAPVPASVTRSLTSRSFPAAFRSRAPPHSR